MDKNLKKELSEMGLLPLELDFEKQKEYKKVGIDWKKIEIHYSPGTSKETINTFKKVTGLVWSLYNQEIEKVTQMKDYKNTKAQIKELLDGINRQKINYIIQTASFGVVRDNYPLL